MSKLLVADIGGTKIDFAVIDTADPVFSPVVEGVFASKDYDSCVAAVSACLDYFDGQVDFLSLAVAGPVQDQQVSFTNLPWQTEATALKKNFSLKGVLLLNDLAALAEGVGLLDSDDLALVKQGNILPLGTRLAVAPGTGLGAAFGASGKTGFPVQATEAGHLSFAPRNEVESKLYSFLHDQYGHVSVEMVCSGTGLGNIFSFLQKSGMAVSDELETQLESSHHLGAILSARVVNKGIDCPISTRTYEIFFDLLAEFCGNLAVTLLPEGGIYLGGGMLLHVAPLMDSQRFVDRFVDRGQMSSLVESFSINIINHPRTALLGAYAAGRRIFLI
ncbi:MAG: glucokinase [Thermodesulfobacteriota bacterium]